MSDILTREQVERMTGQIDRWTAAHSQPIGGYLAAFVAHDAALRARMEEVERERDNWNENYRIMCDVEHNLRQQVADLTARLAASEALLDDPQRLAQAILARQNPFDGPRFEQAPCYLCGYSNGGYYQPAQHPCAVQYHAWVKAGSKGQP